jgi:hypothetical protein
MFEVRHLTTLDWPSCTSVRRMVTRLSGSLQRDHTVRTTEYRSSHIVEHAARVGPWSPVGATWGGSTLEPTSV